MCFRVGQCVRKSIAECVFYGNYMDTFYRFTSLYSPPSDRANLRSIGGSSVEARAPVQRNDAGVVHALVEDHDIPGSLKYLQPMVVGLPNPGHRAGDAPRIRGMLFPVVIQRVLVRGSSIRRAAASAARSS